MAKCYFLLVVALVVIAGESPLRARAYSTVYRAASSDTGQLSGLDGEGRWGTDAAGEERLAEWASSLMERVGALIKRMRGRTGPNGKRTGWVDRIRAWMKGDEVLSETVSARAKNVEAAEGKDLEALQRKDPEPVRGKDLETKRAEQSPDSTRPPKWEDGQTAFEAFYGTKEASWKMALAWKGEEERVWEKKAKAWEEDLLSWKFSGLREGNQGAAGLDRGGISEMKKVHGWDERVKDKWNEVAAWYQQTAAWEVRHKFLTKMVAHEELRVYKHDIAACLPELEEMNEKGLTLDEYEKKLELDPKLVEELRAKARTLAEAYKYELGYRKYVYYQMLHTNGLRWLHGFVADLRHV
ncbi:unnamed protein product [Hyaloperonospora brassicae]|uniref:RxLR effector candidate protein n=1 Tax=Hyaloperonospora brassicae TaxID=162125 RepID=A0AAV0UNT6_HYABA|nr:unnamed protein product [Hyaloperonospora brassicae]